MNHAPVVLGTGQNQNKKLVTDTTCSGSKGNSIKQTNTQNTHQPID